MRGRLAGVALLGAALSWVGPAAAGGPAGRRRVEGVVDRVEGGRAVVEWWAGDEAPLAALPAAALGLPLAEGVRLELRRGEGARAQRGDLARGVVAAEAGGELHVLWRGPGGRLAWSALPAGLFGVRVPVGTEVGLGLAGAARAAGPLLDAPRGPPPARRPGSTAPAPAVPGRGRRARRRDRRVACTLPAPPVRRGRSAPTAGRGAPS